VTDIDDFRLDRIIAHPDVSLPIFENIKSSPRAPQPPMTRQPQEMNLVMKRLQSGDLNCDSQANNSDDQLLYSVLRIKDEVGRELSLA
jgi:hypothetical protein